MNGGCSHDECIFAVVGVVFLADAHLLEAVLPVEVLGDVVGDANFEGDGAHSAGDCLLNRAYDKELTDAVSAVVGADTNGYDVRFIVHVPSAEEADDVLVARLPGGGAPTPQACSLME